MSSDEEKGDFEDEPEKKKKKEGEEEEEEDEEKEMENKLAELKAEEVSELKRYDTKLFRITIFFLGINFLCNFLWLLTQWLVWEENYSELLLNEHALLW